MRIGICEDIDEDRKALGLLIESIKDKLSFQADVVYFSQGRRLLEAVRRGEKFDLLLLDIYLRKWVAWRSPERPGQAILKSRWPL